MDRMEHRFVLTAIMKTMMMLIVGLSTSTSKRSVTQSDRLSNMLDQDNSSRFESSLLEAVMLVLLGLVPSINSRIVGRQLRGHHNHQREHEVARATALLVKKMQVWS